MISAAFARMRVSLRKKGGFFEEVSVGFNEALEWVLGFDMVDSLINLLLL